MRTRLSILALAGLVASCGYSPLYAPGGGADTAARKAQIGAVEMGRPTMDVGQRRIAQTVAQRLKLDFPDTGADMDTVNVVIDESESTLAVERTSTLKRGQINLQSTVTLTNGEGQTILRTNFTSVAAYNVEDSPYSTESGKTFARQTAARTLAEEISRRLALFYRTQGKP